jgi:hypothetical protein
MPHNQAQHIASTSIAATETRPRSVGRSVAVAEGCGVAEGIGRGVAVAEGVGLRAAVAEGVGRGAVVADACVWPWRTHTTSPRAWESPTP